MSVVVNYASSQMLETLPQVQEYQTLTPAFLDGTCAKSCFEIKHKLQSENSRVLFTQHTLTSERVVMKMLRDYKDTRYSLETIDKRQQCLLEALRCNRAFTPEVYIGLARIDEFDLHEKHIIIGKILSEPTKEELEPDAEYVLVMYWLPEDRRLDALLNNLDEVSLREHLQLLTRHVAYLHTHLISSISDEDGVQWGSYEQLQQKLLHNFELLNLVLTAYTGNWNSSYDCVKETIDRLKETMFNLFMRKEYRTYFEWRMRNQRVKRCHGDLKSPNIWILPYNYSINEEPVQYVKILDAIDFNPLYANVDVLSDFAMLVIDVQTRTKSVSLAQEMIEYYLKYTSQDDEVSKCVLGYYLVEKAFVGAAISMLYDDALELGLSLLKVAEMRLQCLVD